MTRDSGGPDPSRQLERLYIEKSCIDYTFTADIVERSGLPHTVIDDKDRHEIIPGTFPDNLGAGKKSLLLCRNRGDYLKQCPATRQYRCCDYRIINVGAGCPMDCVYCILQAYLNNPYLSFFVNIDKLFAELSQKVLGPEYPFIRIGTGELTDSLALDRITGMSRRLVDFFARQNLAVLELKTKSAMIENLEGLDHNGRTIIAWSLNSPEIIKETELGTASLEQRLEAAAQCVSWGYDLAFHFDPIIAYPGWREGYRETVQALFARIPAEAIRWISLGAFRYLPGLKKISTARFPHSTIFYNEFIEGLDGKQRYFRPYRVLLYKELYRQLRALCLPHTCIYFCMESDEIWREVMGFIPSERGGLPAMLDKTVVR